MTALCTTLHRAVKSKVESKELNGCGFASSLQGIQNKTVCRLNNIDLQSGLLSNYLTATLTNYYRTMGLTAYYT